MTPDQVLELVARLEVAYRTELADPERRLWVEELRETDDAIAFAAAEDRIRSSSPFMPKVGELLELVREAYAEAPRRERLALEAGDYVETMPEEVREKVEAMVASSDPDVSSVIEEEVAWKRDLARLAEVPRLRGVCTGVGKVPAERDGVLVCPDCGSPVAEGCRPGGAA